jgi:hypothetical protein
MRSVLIDRSLVGMRFTDLDKELDFSDKKAMFMYVCALAEAGAAYIELDFQSIVRLPKPSGSENFIYRIGAPEEFVVANALSFSYAVVPLKYHYVVSKLELPAILEIEVGSSDVFDVLQLISSNIDLSEFGMLRLIGDFEPTQIPAMISTYRRRSVIPLDICPVNTSLTALDSAIAAYRSVADAVTVSFGDYERFASLEELLIMLSAMYKIIVSGDYLEGICKASLFSAMFSQKKATNLSMMMNKYMYRPLVIEHIDSELTQEEVELQKLRPPSYRRGSYVKSNPAQRVLSSMGLEQETSNEIIKILNDCNMEMTRLKNLNEEKLKQ